MHLKNPVINFKKIRKQIKKNYRKLSKSPIKTFLKNLNKPLRNIKPKGNLARATSNYIYKNLFKSVIYKKPSNSAVKKQPKALKVTKSVSVNKNNPPKISSKINNVVQEKKVKLSSTKLPKKVSKLAVPAKLPNNKISRAKSVTKHLAQSNLPKLAPIKEKRNILRLKDANKLKEKYDARLLRNLTSIQEFQEKHESLAYLIKYLFQDNNDIPQMKLHESAAAMVYNFLWYKRLYERNKITKAKLKELTDTNIENLQALFKQVQELRGGNKYKAALSNMVISALSENLIYVNNEQYYVRTDMTGSSHLGSIHNFSYKDLRQSQEFINHLTQIYNSPYSETIRELMSFNTFRLRVARAIATKFML